MESDSIQNKIFDDFFDSEMGADITVIGDHVIVGLPLKGDPYIDFQLTIYSRSGVPHNESWTDGAMNLAQAKEVMAELSEAIKYLEGLI